MTRPIKQRQLKEPWPFLFSLVNGRLVQNLPPRKAAPKRLRKLPSPDKWTQQEIG